MTISFTAMWKNEPTARIEIVDDEVVFAESYTDDIGKAFILTPPFDMEYIDTLVSMRCFDKNNACASLFLEDLGLASYNPWEIVKKTHAFMWEDFIWFKFDGEELTWEDINHGRV